MAATTLAAANTSGRHALEPENRTCRSCEREPFPGTRRGRNNRVRRPPFICMSMKGKDQGQRSGIPPRNRLIVIHGTFLKGIGIDILWPDLLAMTIIAMLTLCILHFRQSLERSRHGNERDGFGKDRSMKADHSDASRASHTPPAGRYTRNRNHRTIG